MHGQWFTTFRIESWPLEQYKLSKEENTSSPNKIQDNLLSSAVCKPKKKSLNYNPLTNQQLTCLQKFKVISTTNSCRSRKSFRLTDWHNWEKNLNCSRRKHVGNADNGPCFSNKDMQLNTNRLYFESVNCPFCSSVLSSRNKAKIDTSV